MNIQILHLLDGAKAATGLTVIIDVFRAFSFECYLIHQILIGLYAANNPVPADSQLAKITAFVFCLALSVLFALLLNRSGNSKR